MWRRYSSPRKQFKPVNVIFDFRNEIMASPDYLTRALQSYIGYLGNPRHGDSDAK